MNEKDFLRVVKAYLARYYQEEIVSLILFGSMIDTVKSGAPSTDVDMIVVIKDSCPRETFLQMRCELRSIQQHYISQSVQFWDLFFEGLRKATGMFVNSFFCYYSDFRKQNFAKVFGVNPLIAYLLAPQASVWISLKQRHRIVLGKDPFVKWIESPKFKKIDIGRSFLMNSLLAVGALVLGVRVPNTTQFAMESVKWSLYTWWNWYHYPPTPIHRICATYSKQASLMEKLTLTLFLSYRESRESSPYLRILAPLFVATLHRKLLRSR